MAAPRRCPKGRRCPSKSGGGALNMDFDDDFDGMDLEMCSVPDKKKTQAKSRGLRQSKFVGKDCSECFKMIKKNDETYGHLPCHYKCYLSKRSMMRKMTKKRRQRMNQLKSKDPKSYSRAILKNIPKEGQKRSVKQRSVSKATRW